MKNILNIKHYVIFLFIVFATTVIAQNQVSNTVINIGKMSMSSGSLVSMDYNFVNSSDSHVVSDGVLIYSGDFTNDGVYNITPGKKTGSTLFNMTQNSTVVKNIAGKGISEFYDITFDSQSPEIAFDLKNNIDIYGKANFKQGVVKVDSSISNLTKVSLGMVSFLDGSSVASVHDNGHIDGVMEKIGKGDFVFPQGNKGYYRPATITAAKDIKDAFSSKYIYNDNSFFSARPNVAGVIKTLDTSEYWLVEKGSNTLSDVLLTLKWDARTTPSELLKDPTVDLHIVRWDSKQSLWVDEGGVVDLERQEVTTPTSLKGYGFFTLATVKTDWILDGDVVIYNLVSSNDDSKNDYFLIYNIYRFPNNSVEIFNRWGVKVYEATNYDSQGDGSVNVFRGYSEGRLTISKNEKLPTGTYYYIVTYEYKDQQGAQMIKKSGYLHLDTN